MERLSLFTTVTRQCLLATILVFAAVPGRGAETETAPAAEASKPAAETPAPAPEPPKPAAETPAPAPEAPKPAAETPAPAPEAPKPAAETPAPAPETPKPAAETPAPAPEAPKPAAETPAPAPEAPKPAAETPAPAPEPPKPAAETPPVGSATRKRASEASESVAKTPGEPSERRLRFMFRFQRWDDVLEWFAEQADLSLVLDAPPPGTFNYSDTRDYSVSEALDLLNSVLLTKGFTLIRRDRMLTLVDLSGDFPESLIPRVSPEEAKERGRYELVTVEFSLGRRDVAAVTAAVTPLLGTYHKLLPVAPTRQLFVTDRAGIMSNVDKVIQAISEPRDLPAPPVPSKPEPRELKVYPIDKADPDALMAILEKFVSSAQLVFDPNLNQLHVNATASQHAMLQTVLDQITSPIATNRERRVEVYRLDALTEEAATQLVETFKTIAPKAALSWKADDSLLVAWASPAEHEAIGAAVDKLGGSPTRDSVKSSQLEVYRLTRVDPAKLLEMLEKLVPDAKLSYDERSRSLIALAKAADQAAIRATLDQLQAASPADRDEQLRFYPFDQEPPAAVLASLAEVAPQAKITVDAENERLLVVASTADHTALEAAFQQFQQATPGKGKPELAIYPLRSADTTGVLEVLKTLYPQLQIVLDAPARRLLVWASPEEQTSLQASLEKLQTEPAADQQPQFEIYELRGSQTITTTAPLFTQLQAAVPEAKLTVDTQQRRLIVYATPEQQQRVKSALEKLGLDQAADDARVMDVYALGTADPTSTLALLQQLVPGAEFTADAAQQRLVAVAAPADHEQIRTAMEKLRAAPPEDEQPRFESYPIHGFSTAVEAATLVTSLQPLVPKARFTIDGKVKNLIVWAVAEDHEVVRRALERLGQGPAPQNTPQLEVHRLARAEADTTLALLQKLVPDAQLTLDAKSGALVALAVPADQLLIRSTLQQLQSGGAGTGLTVRFHALLQPPTESLLNILKEMVPDAQLTPDAENKRLLAVAAAADHEVIQKIIEQFEADTPLEQPRTLAVYPVTAAQRRRFEAVLPTLQADMPGLQILSDDDPGAMTVWARPVEQIKIAELVKQLEREVPPTEQLQLATYRCAAADPATITEFISKLFPDVKFVVDAKTRRIMVWATPKDHERIQPALEQLSTGQPADFEERFQAYSLSKVPPTIAVPMLQQQLPDAKIVADATSGKVLVWASQADQEVIAQAIEQLQAGPDDKTKPRLVVYPRGDADPATIVQMLTSLVPQARLAVDAQTGGLAAWATPEDHETIRGAIDEMSKAEVTATKPATKVYALKHITSEAALRVLASAVPTAKLSAGADESQLVAVAQPREQQMLQTIIEEIDVEGVAAGKSSVAIYKLEHKTSSTAVLYALSVFRSAFPKANFTLGADAGEFVAWATPKDHEGIQTLVDQLNAGPAPEDAPQVALYTLKSITAASAITVLQTAVPRATLSTDATNAQRLTALARPSDQEKIQSILTVIDVEGEPGSQPSVVVYQLERQTSATAMSYAISLLTQAFPRARLLLGTEPGQFVAWASAKDHEGIKALVAQLNAGPPPEEAPEATVYSLQHVSATAAMTLLTTAVPKAKISTDAENPRRLTAYASPADHAAIKTILERIDVEGDPAGDATVAVYRLEGPTTPIALYYSLAVFRSAFPKVTFSSAAEPGQFAAWATAKEHEGIKALVEQLNAAPAPEDAPKVALYTTKWITASSAAEVLRAAVPKATFTLDTANAQRLTASARPADHDTIKTILAEVDVEGDPGSEPSVVVYQLERQISATATTYAASLLTQAYPRARFLPGTEPGQFVAWASAKDHEGIKALVAQLNAGPPPEEAPEATVYSLQHVSATAAMTLLTTAVPKAKISTDPENPRRLTAYASPADHATIKTILEKIDIEGDPAGDATVAVYRLEGPTTATALYYSLAVFRSAFPKATFSTGAETGQFVAWATAKEHEGIQALVEQLNAAPAPEDAPKVVLYTLQWITATTATSVLQVAVPKATFTADPADPQRLAAHARMADHETIQTVLAEIDVEGDGGGRSSAVVYQLERQTTSTAMTYAISLLTQAFPRARFLTGTEIGQFVAWATPKDQKEIQALVDRLNAGPPPEEAPLATVYSLQHITATSALTLLSTAVPKAKISPDAADPRRLTAYASPADQTAIREILDKIDVESEAPVDTSVAIYLLEGQATTMQLYYTLAVFRTAFPKATFSTGTEPGQFAAWATARDHEGIQALVEKMNAGPPPAQQLQIELYTLNKITATSAAEVLRAAVPKAVFTVDSANAQRLTAHARPADHEMIKTILAKIDVEGDPGTEPSVAVYQLERQASTTGMSYALTLLTQAFPRARFLLGTEPGQFVAWAGAKDQAGIQALVDRLNAGPPPEEAPVATVYPLQHVTATAAVTLLTTAVPRAKLASDIADPRRLTAYASPADQAIIKEILDKIDVEGDPTGGATVAVYQLAGQPAATTISYTLLAFRTAFPRSTFSVGAEPGQIVAWATVKDHEGIQALVEQLNAGPPPDQQLQVELYALNKITATSAAEVLRAAVPKAIFTVDSANAQRLTANARPADHEMIKTILAKIDVEGDPGTEPSVAVYQLERQASTTGMTYTFSLLTGAFPAARFLTGTEPGQFVAWASAKDQAGIQALVDRLNAGPPPEEAPVATVYPLQHVTATTAITLLTTAVPRAKLASDTADPRRLTAYASPADQAIIKEILDKIDVEGDPTGGATVVVYQLESPATATTLSYTLLAFRSAFPRATFSVGAEPGQIVAWATAKDHEGIKALVEQLNAGPPPEQKPQVVLYTLQFITATAAADVLRTAVPKATFTIDPDDPQRLAANARAADHETIKQILAEIDVEGEGGGRSTVEVYRLLGPQSATAMTYAFRLLTTAFPRARFSLGTEPDQFVAWASPRDHVEIRALVERLNAAPPADEAPRAVVYSLKNITATAALSVLTSALPRAKLNVDAADPQRLTAYAIPLEHATLQEILDQIDVAGDPDASYSVRIYTLEGMSTRALYYTGTFLARVLPNARFTPGAEESQLVVWATAKDHEQIEGLIEQLQKEPPPEQARKIAVYALQHLTGEAAASLLRAAVPRAELTTSPGDAQRLNAWASPADHTRIQAILKEVDVKPDPESAATAVVYQLENMSQTAAMYAMRFLRDAVPQANFALGGEGGQLVAWARPADHEIIAQLVKQLVEESPDAARTAQVYNLQHVTATTALTALSPVVPRANLTVGADPSQLAAFARPQDHAKIAEILKQLDKPAPPETEPTAVVYTLPSGNAVEAMRIVRTAVPQANLSTGAEPHQMIAWARPVDHKIIAQIVERLGEKGPEELARKVAVYTIETGDASVAMTLLRTAVPGAQFSVGSDPRRLIAWATPTDHQAIQRAVDEIAAGAAQMTSQVYRLRYANPQTALTVLQALVPLAKLAVDTQEGTLVASALPEDHLKIKATIEQMDAEDADGQRPALKIHRVAIGSVSNVYRSLALLFRTDATVQLSLDIDNDAVIAIASGAKQERIAELVKSLEDAARQDAQATIELYSLRNVDSRSALRLLEQMLDKQAGKADLSIDQLSNQLVAVAPAEVHEQIAKTLEQLRGEEFDLEIYDLQYVDPISAETAILRQFVDDGARAPEVSIDPITQQLFIRATAEQQQKIRELLIKMGETRLALLRGRSSQNMRTVPFQGDPKAAVEQIRRIWSTLRDNEIRIVGPDQPLPPPLAKPTEPKAEAQPAAEQKPAEAPAAEPKPAEPAKPDAEPQPAAEQKPAEEAKPAETPAAEPKPAEPAKPDMEPQPTAEQKPAEEAKPAETPAAEPKPAEPAKPDMEPKPAAEEKPAEEAKPAETPAAEPKPAESAKPDAEPQPAAEQKEEEAQAESADTSAARFVPSPFGSSLALLSTTTSVQLTASPAPSPADGADTAPVAHPPSPAMAAPPPPAATSPDQPPQAEPAPIYIVPSDGSITIVCDDPEALEQFEKLLRAMSGTVGEIGRNISIFELKHSNAIEIAEKLRELYDTRLRSWRLGGSEVVIVPDERLNRILVQGSRIDRETIDGLIRALDTEEGTASRPQIVPVRYAEATEVANVVREVFRSQLTRTTTAATTTTRTRGSTASRIAPQVAVDEATNSLIVMAPSPLLDEILKLVSSLDEAAENNPARRLKIITLQKTNAARVDEALQRILKTRSPRPSR